MTIFQIMLWILATVGAITSVYFGLKAINHIVYVIHNLKASIHFREGYLHGKMDSSRSIEKSYEDLEKTSTWYHKGYIQGRYAEIHLFEVYSFTEEERARLIQLIGDAVEFNGEELSNWEAILKKLSLLKDNAEIQ